MKTRTAVLAGLLMLAVTVSFSQAPKLKYATLEQKIALAKKNLIIGLHSDNTGLVESCIKMTTKVKLYAPSTDISDLQERLEELSVTHPSATVRYKAYIASSICANPEWYAQDQNIITADEDQFFINAAHRLQQKLFGLNSY